MAAGINVTQTRSVPYKALSQTSRTRLKKKGGGRPVEGSHRRYFTNENVKGQLFRDS